MSPLQSTNPHRSSVDDVLIVNDTIAHSRVGKSNEPETTGMASVSVFHDHGIRNLPILLEVACQVVCRPENNRCETLTRLQSPGITDYECETEITGES